MYADFFDFRELPFNNTPDPRFFFSTPDHDEALASLIYATTQRKGFVLLTGEIGAGKTLLTRMMIRHFANAVAFANINHSVQNPNDLMGTICTEFELPFDRSDSETHLIRILHDYLLAKFAQNIPVVLVLDEAQNISIDAFERLRMIGNLESDDAKLLQIAIVGQPELQAIFAKPGLRQLRQRIFRAFHLPALDRETTKGYILHRLGVVSDSAQNIFSADAIETIFHASQGLPRVVNTICDNALLSAYAADRKRIDSRFVNSVLSQIMLAPDSKDLNSTAAHSHAPVESSTTVSPEQHPRTLRETTRDLVYRAFGNKGRRNNNAQNTPVISFTRSPSVCSKPSTAPTDIIALRRELKADRKRLAALETDLYGMVERVARPDVLQHKMERLVRDAENVLNTAVAATKQIARCEKRVANADRSVTDVIEGLRQKQQQAVQEIAGSHRTVRTTQAAKSQAGQRQGNSSDFHSERTVTPRPGDGKIQCTEHQERTGPSGRESTRKAPFPSDGATRSCARDRLRQCVANVKASLDALKILESHRNLFHGRENSRSDADPVPQDRTSPPPLEPVL